ncbi:MAG: sugar phosphate isomerase/epimerase [Sphingomonadales bacterium]|nr:sugar phosphate isomerase/epimerase [Sphingomonadales bacterium]
MDRIGIEFISVFGLPPVDFVELAAGLGCGWIGFAPSPIVGNPHGYPAWSLRGNASLERELAQALADNGVRIALGEGFLIRPGADIAACAADLDLMARLGAGRVNVTSIEGDMARNVAEFGLFADMAAERGLPASVEFLPGFAVGTMQAALDLLDAADRPGTGVLVDAMHYFRTGGTVAELAAIDPARIVHAQLCDVPEVSTWDAYMDEARCERGAPGEGELPLAGFVSALPSHVLIGLEVPMQARALAGIGPGERLAPALAAARALCQGV